LNLNFDFVEAFGENPPKPGANCGLRFEEFERRNTDGRRRGGVTGKASAEYIETAVRLWREKKIDAIATAPISKKAISLGGYDYPGHTEFLAHLTGHERICDEFFRRRFARRFAFDARFSCATRLNFVKKEKLVDLINFTIARNFEILK
jgi:4-hydroxy-L-threonine phosphate dehydrogenase PdxA